MRRVLIMGAAGRDFHNFNTFFRNNRDYKVVCFTATQIPNIDGRKYPGELAGPYYPTGIPIYPEKDLTKLIKRFDVDIVVFSYSDISHEYVMHKASEALAAGADFWLLGPKSSILKSVRKVISICAVRTGAGKSQTTRRVCEILNKYKVKFSVVRHPMPYGDLLKQEVQSFSSIEDLDKYNCTIEEREEFEPHIKRGNTVFAGVDYFKILKLAEKISDVIVWDGGNNDLPFFEPDLHIVVVDPLRLGNESTYHPGEANLRMADIVIINKIDSAPKENVEKLKKNIKTLNKNAKIIEAYSPIVVDRPELIKNKRVLVIEDGPTLTHGEMSFGAGIIAARQYKAKEIIDPRLYAVGSIKKAYVKYPHIGKLIPALGYSKLQMEELNKSINRTPADVVVIGTPVDLRKFLKINKPAVKVSYELKEKNRSILEEEIKKLLKD
ncbi:MAG: cyclic 2,3-diphosphoglycerate synthase [candidate division WOR-3 bacterium]|nr:cyclic 2,3-diphosphoglycerate synthase [candidate division WOR-3 bacterium]